jgi:hypothetical protein
MIFLPFLFDNLLQLSNSEFVQVLNLLQPDNIVAGFIKFELIVFLQGRHCFFTRLEGIFKTSRFLSCIDKHRLFFFKLADLSVELIFDSLMDRLYLCDSFLLLVEDPCRFFKGIIEPFLFTVFEGGLFICFVQIPKRLFQLFSQFFDVLI